MLDIWLFRAFFASWILSRSSCGKLDSCVSGFLAAGYRGKTGDCVVRSIAIATGPLYQQIYDPGPPPRKSQARD